MVNKNTWMCSISLVTEETKIPAMIKYHYMSITMNKTKSKLTIVNVDKDIEKLEFSDISEHFKMAQHFEN